MSFEERKKDLSIEIIELQRKIERKKEEYKKLIEFESKDKIDSALRVLEESILEVQSIDPEAITDFEERVFRLFQAKSRMKNTHSITAKKTPQEQEKDFEYYAVWVQRRCSLSWSYQIESIENIKTGFLSRVNQVDGYSYDDPDLIKIIETPAEKAETDYEFYKTVERLLDRQEEANPETKS